MGQAGARFCLSLLRRVMQGAPCHAHRHRHMMHFFTHAVKALTTMAPKHPPRRPGVRAAIMRQPLDPEQSSIHGRSNLGEASAGPEEAGLCRSTAGWCWAARTHACACIGLSRRRRQSWRLLECCGSVDRCVQQLVPPSLRPGSELDCGMAIAHMLAHMWPKQARRRVHSQAWFTQKCALLHTRFNRNREVMHG